MKRYVCAFGETTMWNRCYGVGEGCFWVVSIGVSLCFFVPLAVYGALGYVFCGPTGVFLLAVVLNTLNLVFEWTTWGLLATVVLACIGVFSHYCACALEQAHCHSKQCYGQYSEERCGA
ncbi:hypothetical protein PI125_g22865 [Phytophthora idaei]|nr:hypothetical protein PI125_g22865 [Phytophthora idaei]